MVERKRFIVHLLGLLAVLIGLSPSGPVVGKPQAEMSAREIMEKVENRDVGDNGTSNMEMVLVDQFNRRRTRNIKNFFKEEGEVTQKVLFFTNPSDVRGTGFLTRSYKDSDREDEQWIYLPALRKTKRIASSDKNESFMGSDFSYSDMTSKDVNDYDYSIVKEAQVKGKGVWLIQAVPRSQNVIDETGYKKSILFVRKDNYVVIRAVYWVADKPLLKYMDVQKLESIDGILVATETRMTTKEGTKFVHQTLLKLTDVRFDQKLADNLFTLHRLEHGL